jgi:hypothetical protein
VAVIAVLDFPTLILQVNIWVLPEPFNVFNLLLVIFRVEVSDKSTRFPFVITYEPTGAFVGVQVTPNLLGMSFKRQLITWVSNVYTFAVGGVMVATVEE